MKKLLVTILSVFVIVSSFSFASLAEGTTKISVDDITASTGTVYVPVKISNNQGLWGMVVDVEFDTSVFEVQEVLNNGEVFKTSDLMIGPSDFNQGYVRIVVTSTSVSQNNINNGTICILKLNVPSNASLDTYKFTVKCDDACNVNGTDISITTASGSVTLKEGVKNTVDTSTKEAEVIAKAENNILIDEETTGELKTEVLTEYVTDANGEYVTNKDGEKQTETQIVEVTVAESDEADEPGTINSDEELQIEIYAIIIIIAVAVVIAGIIVLIVVLVKKKKAQK